MGYYEELLQNLEAIKQNGGCDNPICKTAYDNMREMLEWRIRDNANRGMGKKALATFAKQLLKTAASNPLLNGAWIADGKQWICDGHMIIEIPEAEALDLPKNEYPNPPKVSDLTRTAERDGFIREIKFNEDFIAELKSVKARYPKRKYCYRINDTIAINAEWIASAVKSVGELTMSVPTDPKAIYKLTNGNGIVFWILAIKCQQLVAIEGNIAVV